MQGIVFNIERYAVHDGPGIRTLVFLKGCPLRCLWCCNPESQVVSPQLLFDADKCVGCRACVEICPVGAVTATGQGTVSVDRSKCQACGKCIAVCPTGARSITGKKMTVDEVIREVEKDRPFYRRSGGGVTLSGGEPLLQFDFAKAILTRLKEEYIHTAIETTAHLAWDKIQEVLPLIDLWMMDIKHMDPEQHKKLTGVSNELILENARRISDSGKAMRIRVPVIPGLNDSSFNIKATGDFIAELDALTGVDLLPYHRLGATKYTRLGRKYELECLQSPSKEEMSKIKQELEEKGLLVTIGGLE